MCGNDRAGSPGASRRRTRPNSDAGRIPRLGPSSEIGAGEASRFARRYESDVSFRSSGRFVRHASLGTSYGSEAAREGERGGFDGLMVRGASTGSCATSALLPAARTRKAALRPSASAIASRRIFSRAPSAAGFATTIFGGPIRGKRAPPRVHCSSPLMVRIRRLLRSPRRAAVGAS